jgi:hypothetical protein
VKKYPSIPIEPFTSKKKYKIKKTTNQQQQTKKTKTRLITKTKQHNILKIKIKKFSGKIYRYTKTNPTKTKLNY